MEALRAEKLAAAADNNANNADGDADGNADGNGGAGEESEE